MRKLFLLTLACMMLCDYSYCAKLQDPYIESPEKHIEIPYYALDGCQVFTWCIDHFENDFSKLGIDTNYIELYAYYITKFPQRDSIVYLFLVRSEDKFCCYRVKCSLRTGGVTFTSWDYRIANQLFPGIFAKDEYVKPHQIKETNDEPKRLS